MARIEGFQLHALDLPFKKPFKHAAAARASSSSLFLKCTLDNGDHGFGEALPREYVTGESRDAAFEQLARRVLPRLVGREFDSMSAVRSFLAECDGKAPSGWIPREEPQIAAWSAVDVALLDTFGRHFGEPAIPLPAESASPRADLRYSGVMSADVGFAYLKSCLKFSLFGFRAVKLKVDERGGVGAVRTLRRILGQRADIRVDANMAWERDQAIRIMQEMSEYGVRSFEEPLPAGSLEDQAAVVRETGLGVMADESFSSRESLAALVAAKACTAVNVRVSKCGGVVAATARCREALAAGLVVQVGCQVGETSLLSAAHLGLVASVPQVTYAEGCFGLFLLREDPVSPLLQFSYGGKPPARPTGAGFGVEVDESLLARHSGRIESIQGKAEG